ncbi:hypothetical protein NQ317_010648 [Molorchus minor]|uniref:Tyr recombinase domain-containing protein n=1 Tax=Molorchus minor TaxID=1323400 RepID=A0ABQ9IQU0_9CUCU|nr:hypothetical protein NQ317_010648 [Molorchus minor]
MNNCESEEIVEAANIAISNLLPTKSRSLYDIAYNRFKKWCAEKKYISKFPKLIAFLKRTGDGYQAKKSKILTKSEIDRFLSSADDKEFLMIKVGLILGIAGACRTDELVNLTVDDIEDVGSSLIVKIPGTKTKIPRIFVVTDVGNMLELFRKYLSLRPPHVKHKRLFLYYKAGKCSSQPVGKNTMGKFLVSSATLLADAGVDITTIKRHAGWKSTTVAEGYVENSIENKTKIANQVLVELPTRQGKCSHSCLLLQPTCGWKAWHFGRTISGTSRLAKAKLLAVAILDFIEEPWANNAKQTRGHKKPRAGSTVGKEPQPRGKKKIATGPPPSN